MRKVLVALGIIVSTMAVAQPALSQAIIMVPLDRAAFEWQPGVGGSPADEFVVRCGVAVGVRTLEAVVPGTQTVLAVSTVVPAPGTYFCAVVGRNAFGESNESNEINFETGFRPNEPILQIKVK